MGKRINPKEIVGKKFNKLFVVKYIGLRSVYTFFDKHTGKKRIIKAHYFLYRCECGREKEISLGNLKRQKGCRYCGVKKTNPKYKNTLCMTWKAFITRNYRKTRRGYKLRDKNSILVCDRWLTNFDAFVKDAGERPTPKHIFGRLDPYKGFTPDNAKWMTRLEKGKLRKHSDELIMTNISKKVGITNERIRQITDIALKNKDDELINLIERIDYSNTNKRVVFKPEAIEYFKKKKYFKKIRFVHKSELIVKEYYLKGEDIEKTAEKLNKSIASIKRYYKKFASAGIEQPSKKTHRKPIKKNPDKYWNKSI